MKSWSICLSHFSLVTQSCLTHCDPMNCSMPGLSVHHQLPEFTQTHVHWVRDAIQPSHPLSSPSPPALNLSLPSIRVFSNESALRIRWLKYWSFSFSISPSNEYTGLISFRMDWLDLLAGQGTLKSLLQHHSSKASILQCSAFFIVQLSHPYMTTGKNIALTRQTFVVKVMSLLFNMLSRLVRRRQWHPTPVLLPGKSHGRRSLVGCSPWGRWESDFTFLLSDFTFIFTFMHWRRQWQPTPGFLPGVSQGQGSLVGCRLWGRTESDTTEAT